MIRQMLVSGAMALVMGFMAIPQYDENYYININETKEYTANYSATWFDEIQHILARGDDAAVRDVATGRVFNIRRTFGTNHADIEPLTAADAAIMNDIWGGHSWERRAVAVYVAGQVFAGSLTNFPHAGVDGQPALATVNNRSGGYGRGLNFDAVAGNGVDGHMCLHFAGSMTHGNNRVNAAHQDAVAAAIEFIRANY